jgi:hypothetical protein
MMKYSRFSTQLRPSVWARSRGVRKELGGGRTRGALHGDAPRFVRGLVGAGVAAQVRVGSRVVARCGCRCGRSRKETRRHADATLHVIQDLVGRLDRRSRKAAERGRERGRCDLLGCESIALRRALGGVTVAVEGPQS